MVTFLNRTMGIFRDLAGDAGYSFLDASAHVKPPYIHNDGRSNQLIPATITLTQAIQPAGGRSNRVSVNQIAEVMLTSEGNAPTIQRYLDEFGYVPMLYGAFSHKLNNERIRVGFSSSKYLRHMDRVIQFLKYFFL